MMMIWIIFSFYQQFNLQFRNHIFQDFHHKFKWI